MVFIGRHTNLLTKEAGYGNAAHLIELRNMVPYAKALAELRRAAVLLLMRTKIWKSTAISGKIYDYAAFETPLLSVSGAPGIHSDLIRWLGGGLWTDSAIDIAGFIAEHFRRWQATGTTRVERNPEALAYLSQRRVAAEFAQVFDAAVAGRQPALRTSVPWDVGQ
jgi:hypothetical protein